MDVVLKLCTCCFHVLCNVNNNAIVNVAFEIIASSWLGTGKLCL